MTFGHLFPLSSSPLLSGIISPSSHHRLCSICRYSTSIQSLLAQVNSIITISIHLSTRIRLDCLYHTGISLILTLLSCSTSIEPWDESTLTPTTTNCSTWAPAYRSAPPPPFYLHQHILFHDNCSSSGTTPKPSGNNKKDISAVITRHIFTQDPDHSMSFAKDSSRYVTSVINCLNL